MRRAWSETHRPEVKSWQEASGVCLLLYIPATWCNMDASNCPIHILTEFYASNKSESNDVVERLEQKIGLATFDRSSASTVSVGWVFDGKTSDNKKSWTRNASPHYLQRFILVWCGGGFLTVRSYCRSHMQSPYIHIVFRIIYPLSLSRPVHFLLVSGRSRNQGRNNIPLRYYYTVDTKQKMFYAAIPAELEALESKTQIHVETQRNALAE